MKDNEITLKRSSVILEKEATEEQKGIMARMLELGIHPIRAKSNGVDFTCYMIDKDGKYWGCKRPEPTNEDVANTIQGWFDKENT